MLFNFILPMNYHNTCRSNCLHLKCNFHIKVADANLLVGIILRIGFLDVLKNKEPDKHKNLFNEWTFMQLDALNFG